MDAESHDTAKLDGLYSVFVGHLSQETSRRDVLDLFTGCGQVADLFIVENTRHGCFNYGFVRYKKMESAIKAVKDLHRWPLKGTKLVVDLSKDTFEKIQKEEKTPRVEKLVIPAKKKNPEEQQRLKTATHVQDALYLSRVKETCVSLNMDIKLKTPLVGDDKTLHPIDVDTLMDDIIKTDTGRMPSKDGALPEEPGVEKIKEKLLLGENSTEIGREKVKDFVGALNSVMSTITLFLRSEDIVNYTNMESDEASLHTDVENMEGSHHISDMSGDFSLNKTDSLHSDNETRVPKGLRRGQSYTDSPEGENNDLEVSEKTQANNNYLLDTHTNKGDGTHTFNNKLEMCAHKALGGREMTQKMHDVNHLQTDRPSLNKKCAHGRNLHNELEVVNNSYQQGIHTVHSKNPPISLQTAEVIARKPSCSSPTNPEENPDQTPRGKGGLLQSSVVKNYFAKAIAGRGRSFNKLHTTHNPGWKS